MKKSILLAELMKDWLPVKELPNLPISFLTNDSRQVSAGSLFMACPGINSDGRDYIPQAIKQGAAAVLYHLEEAPHQIKLEQNVVMMGVPKLQENQGQFASRFYGNPSDAMTIIGVTGTNGKTSCTHFIAETLQHFQRKCGIVGTLGHGFLNHLQQMGLTTSDVVSLHQKLAELKEHGADTVAMEVSSHALDQHRVSGVNFDIAVFTQLSRDHLDYHHDMESYAAAKTKLFHQPGLKMGVVNLDDTLGAKLAKSCMHLQMVGYSLQGHTNSQLRQVYAKKIIALSQGFEVHIATPWGEEHFQTSLFGEFNLYNLLAVFSTLGMVLQEHLPDQVICKTIAETFQHIQPVSGRMQRFGGEKLPTVIVDYAHTPDALEKVLKALRSHCKGKLWCVFGCGGDRDRGKRPLMGEVATKWSDIQVVTNDNPRSEDPTAIVNDIDQGISNKRTRYIEYDRGRAIEYAIKSAQIGDIILVAGKGHEDYQIIGQNRFHFSDSEQVQQQLNLWK